ncbi:YihA family ribosome biogenesis GTP-binding protein [Candidatus Peregrinibacteria bacterium]|nr:YihA family ribosome biogenesis GTP-binding protein [Candidatus Peregrinibacteria bacterium]
MKIKTAEFIRGIKASNDIPEKKLPHITVIGRSNVGKSTFINTITQSKKLAKTGSKPGVTQQVNLFLINKSLYLTDLPGYGYAKLSKTARKELEELILWHLGNDQNFPIDKIILLIDSKVGPTEQDIDIIDFIKQNDLDTVIVTSKADKIKQNQKVKLKKNLQNLLPEANIIHFSAVNGAGVKEVLKEFNL